MEIDFKRYYKPQSVAGLFIKAMAKVEPNGRTEVEEVAARLGISRSYAYKVQSGNFDASYAIQVMLERFLEPGGLVVIDAEARHDPNLAPTLVAAAVARIGSQIRLADQMGVSRDYLRKLTNKQRQMPFGTQVMLEEVTPRPPP